MRGRTTVFHFLFANRDAAMPALLNVRPLTPDDLCFDLLSVRALQDQIISVNGCLHGITNYQTVTRIAGMPTQSFTTTKVHHIPDLHLINGVIEPELCTDSWFTQIQPAESGCRGSPEW
jgi:hypothetical protein